MTDCAVVPAEIIQSVVGQLLEEMYFCAGEWDGQGPAPMDSIGSIIRFSGTFAGELRITVSVRLAKQLAADFLAVEPDEIDVPQAEAMVSELANVACGATLAAWMPEGNFNLAPPGHLDSAVLTADWPSRFHLDGGAAELGVDLILAD